MNILNILTVPNKCIPAISEHLSERTVTDKSDNAHIYEKDVVKEEEEGEFGSGIASD